MSVFSEIYLTPPCKHALVNTKMIDHRCDKCKRYRWPWSKAVGCIKCMKVWHRRCGPEFEDDESDGMKYVVVVTKADEDSADGVFAAYQWSYDSPPQVRRTPAGDAPEPDGQLLPPVRRALWTRDGYLHPKSVTAGSCLERYISRRSSPVPMHPVIWPKRRLPRTVPFPPEDLTRTQVVEEEKSLVSTSTTLVVVGRFPDHRPRPATAVRGLTTLTWTCALAFGGRMLLTAVSVDGWPLPVSLPDWIRQRIAAAATTATSISPLQATILGAPSARFAGPMQAIAAPLEQATRNSRACRRPNCKNRRCRERRKRSAINAANNGSS